MSAPAPELDHSTPSQWTEASSGAVPGTGARLTVADLQTWWKRWDDPQLNVLVDRALAQNLNLAQALGRLKQQRLLMGVASASYKPEFTAGARTLQDVAAVDSYFHASIDATWDLGLFGARESSMAAARGELLNAQAQLRGASINLVADTVRRYLDIRLAQSQRVLLAQRVALDQRALGLSEVRLAQQIDSSDSVHQARMQWQQSRSQLIELKEQQSRAAHALAVLLGQAQPDAEWLAETSMVRLPLPEQFALQVLPADLLRTRPDIETAEASVQRAAGALGLSRSALYPRFALSGSLLYSYNLTQNLRTTSNQMPLVGPIIDIPLFDWWRRRSQADADEAALDVAIAGYRQSVLEGIADVEGALAGLNAQRERMAALLEAEALIRKREGVLERRQKLGLSSDWGRLAEQRADLVNRADQNIAQGAQALAYVALFKALGGAPLPVEPESATEAAR
ncbi:TolC family protein [Diaphorobacter sp. HDW4A]|uniref:TolC family protein n=1 Tax=Diaphorobacter sp. HDW4A TaxID=2714924 RepID=UPI00140A0E95|nr:TolC family protein [Diaphorobacter sp. HDW4A]